MYLLVDDIISDMEMGIVPIIWFIIVLAVSSVCWIIHLLLFTLHLC